MLPSTFLDLSAKEQAFIIASIDIKIKNEKEQSKKQKENKG